MKARAGTSVTDSRAIREHAPMATVCCNACRTCVETNAISLALATMIAAAGGLARFGRRHVVRHS